MENPYTPQYFAGFRQESLTSAEVLVPILMKLLSPATVIDVGCGIGAWLSAFRQAGVREIRGIDGDYVKSGPMLIPESDFTAQDLAKPYAPDREYDLAMSVEVAEHLPESSARGFVDLLTSLAPVVLFSAAIPHQPGERHINCQWPSFWAAMFRDCGYVCIDALRPLIWSDSRIAWWYRQNIFLYVDERELGKRPELKLLVQQSSHQPLPLVHPEMLALMVEWGIGEQQKYWDLYTQIQTSRKPEL